MSERATRLGDTTCHGGVILGGSENVIIDGKPAARLGDLHSCPNPGHTINVVCSGYSNILINGRPGAAVGEFCVCGASITSGSSTVLYGREQGSSGADETTADATATLLESYDEFFIVIDESSNQPVANRKYRIVTARGQTIEGITDGMGRTRLVGTGNAPDTLKFYLAESDET